MTTIKAALVVIGNEILSGRTQDTNTQWIAQRLGERGIRLAEIRVVPDIETEIVRAVNALRGAADYIFTTGGIGPTHDDITAASIAKAFGTELYAHSDARSLMEEYYKTKDLSPARLKMAMIPQGASLIPNPVSGAPGFVMENVFVMAGVPKIMQGMLENILPLLKEGKKMLSATIGCDLPESAIADELSALQDRYADVEIGSYPSYRSGPRSLNIVLRSVDESRLRQAAGEFTEIARRHGAEPVEG